MERRLLTFIVASSAFIILYVTLKITFGIPEPKQLPENVAGADAAADVAMGDLADAAGVQPADANTATDSEVDPEQNAASDTAGEQKVVMRPTAARWSTLGSMAEQSGHLMLVTLTTRGGGVERIELTERRNDGSLKYRRVDVRHGYLGYFAGQSALKVDGVTVNVVGPGTPAAAAGIVVGDIITSIAGQPTSRHEDIDRALLTTKPGDNVVIDVLRHSAANHTGESEGSAEDPLSARSLSLQAKLSEHPLDLVRLARDGGADQIAGNLSRLSCLMTLGQVNRKKITTGRRSISGIVDPAELIWSHKNTGVDDHHGAEFSVLLSDVEMDAIGGGSVRLDRTYSLAPGSYAIDMSVEVVNLSNRSQQLAYRLEGANGITLEGWWYSNKITRRFSGAAARDVVCKTTADGHRLFSGYELLKLAKSQPEDPAQNIFAMGGAEGSRDMQYIGIDAQYFIVGYVPPEGESSLTTFRRASANLAADENKVERHKERAVNSAFYLDSLTSQLEPGESMRRELRMFAGPKQPDLVAQYGMQDCIYYGWFAIFAEILVGLLHVLSGVGNYAIAIILLTVIVRGLMFPLSRKAAINAQRMQELAPELKKITEQYKDDMEGRMKAQRELQKRVGFNPLAGCLPMFLQLPIFMGLYRALSVDIELRQEAVFSWTDWASNLAGPDMMNYWGDWLWDYLSGRGTGWLGPYFNILPVIVVVLFLAQQKMFMPPATDEQTAMTQKMMSIMTLMMGLFFFRVPAGLCIYFITSSLWGICERILVKKTLPSTPHFDASVIEGTATPTAPPKKTPSLTDRIRQQVAKKEEPVERPNKRRRPNGKKKK